VKTPNRTDNKATMIMAGALFCRLPHDPRPGRQVGAGPGVARACGLRTCRLPAAAPWFMMQVGRLRRRRWNRGAS